MRGAMLEVVHQDFIRTARAKGLSERTVIFKHALRNALIPIITLLGLYLPFLLSGAVLGAALGLTGFLVLHLHAGGATQSAVQAIWNTIAGRLGPRRTLPPSWDCRTPSRTRTAGCGSPPRSTMTKLICATAACAKKRSARSSRRWSA